MAKIFQSRKIEKLLISKEFRRDDDLIPHDSPLHFSYLFLNNCLIRKIALIEIKKYFCNIFTWTSYSRYFNKGIAFKHNLSYGNYFGFC